MRRARPAGALLAAALAAACGFGPEDTFTGARVGDGIAAWQDLGPIELCRANVRVGSPSAPFGGFCASQAAPPDPPCQRDADCGSREACVCGRCTIRFCSSSAECPEDRVCTFTEKRCDRPCLADTDCPGPAEFCRSGVCTGRCGSDADCQTGEVCASSGRCVVDDCQDDTGCLAGEECRIQREPRATAEPTVLADAAGFVMWLEMSNLPGTQRAIWRAVSRDGVRWRLDPARPVLEDGGDARAPSVVRAPGAGYRLYYETAAGIFAAESADGIAFGAPGLVVAGDLHAPAAATTPAGDVLLFVHLGGGSAIARVEGGVATPVFRPIDTTDPVLWRDVQRVRSPYLIADDASVGPPAVRLWFSAFGTESAASEQFGELVPIPPNDSIGYAAAPLGDPAGFVTWPFNPVFDRVVAFLDHRSELGPAVVRIPGQDAWLLYYGGARADGSEPEGLGVARNPPRAD